MASFDRKLRRNASRKLAKQLKKGAQAILEDAVKAKMESFSKVPDNCTTCNKPFDKTSREQAFSWMMQIYEEDEIYNLFCPECYKSEEGDQKNEE